MATVAPSPTLLLWAMLYPLLCLVGAVVALSRRDL
jgi:hypothetical protein